VKEKEKKEFFVSKIIVDCWEEKTKKKTLHISNPKFLGEKKNPLDIPISISL
jgi:hypothetical protein